MTATVPDRTSQTLALLDAVRDGRRGAFDDLYAHVYDELRRLARGVRLGRGRSLNTTSLVHEAYLKLLPEAQLDLESRRHFMRLAARAMRQILIDKARAYMAKKRGGDQQPELTFDDQAQGETLEIEDVLALDRALERLAESNRRAADVVEQRFFAGRSLAEAAEILQVSVATVERDWRVARAWLAVQLRDSTEVSGPQTSPQPIRQP